MDKQRDRGQTHHSDPDYDNSLIIQSVDSEGGGQYVQATKTTTVLSNYDSGNSPPPRSFIIDGKAEQSVCNNNNNITINDKNL